MLLETYHKKRDFKKTPEPQGSEAASRSGRLYVIQKHAARRLHYDLRLEVDGVLKSWAVPKGPSLDPAEKRLAVEVEDHPVAYGGFEGIIPKGEYGGGTVLVWDQGQWEPIGDPAQGLRKGHLKFRLYGHKLKGRWALVRMQSDTAAQPKNWLLIKERDAFADAAVDIAGQQPRSVASGRTIEEVAVDRDQVWQAGGARAPAERPVRPADDPRFDPSGLPGARKADPPHPFHPQLAATVDTAPEGGEWLHEIKYDGYRIICLLQEHRVTLMTRNGNDWTDRLGEVVAEAADLPVSRAILDGEVVVLRPDGTSDFQALQNYFKGRREGRLVYYVFDLPYLQGFDLSAVALARRKQVLEQLLGQARTAILQFGSQIAGQGETVYQRACQLGTEGIVSKKGDAVYEQRRTNSWLKVKCRPQQEFVIGGYTVSQNAPAGLRSLLVGYHEPSGRLKYAGKVGTGFSDRQRQELRGMLDERQRSTASFSNAPREKNVVWADPQLVAQVVFAQWTREGLLRQAAFKGLRQDKPARQVVLETKPSPIRSRARILQSDANGLRLSHPARILYPQSGITKTDLLHYYRVVSDRIMPHIVRRPLTLVRCPKGIGEDCFYQKHFDRNLPDALREIRIREKGREHPYIFIDSPEGLMAMAQISALEIHPWGSQMGGSQVGDSRAGGIRVDEPDLPDTIVFDLDPDPDLEWEKVIHAAWHLRGILQGHGLRSFVKTSGGKGLHVQLPIERGPDWLTVKKFARRIAQDMAADQPLRYTTNPRKNTRRGKIFIDYLRNARGATSIAPYCPRARPGAALSVPLHWRDLSHRLGPEAFSLQHLPDYLGRSKTSARSDPWQDYFRIKNTLP